MSKNSDQTVIEAEIVLRGLEDELAEALVKALKPEADIRLRGVKASISKERDGVHVAIKAPDHSSFRATLNSLLRLSASILKTIEIVGSRSNV